MKRFYKFLIIVFLLLIATISLSYCKKEIFVSSSSIKILHLVLYSHDDSYDKMYNITSEYYKKFPYVKTIYYTYNDNISSEYELRGDILYIKGKESYVPGILEKTIRTLEYFQESFNNYDYVVRTNASTIINFDLLVEKLHTETVDYGSGLVFKLSDHYSDAVIVNEDKNIFASGTSIILSIPSARELIQNKRLLKYDIIDDLAIGIYFNDHNENIIPKSIDSGNNEFVFVDDNTNLDVDRTIFYINRNRNRENDVSNMKKIVNHLTA